MLTTKKHPTFLFDLDGTLVETAPDLCAALNHVFTKKGYSPLAVEQIRPLTGEGIRALIEGIMPIYKIQLTEIELNQTMIECIKYYEQNIEAHGYIYQGVIPLLQQAQKAHIRLGIVTNKPFYLSYKLIRRIGLLDFFPVLIGGDTLNTKKPSPEPIQEAMRQLNSDPHNTIMIGDNTPDILAAKSANIASMGVTFGYANTPLDEFGADIVIDDYADFITSLKQIKPNMARLMINKQ